MKWSLHLTALAVLSCLSIGCVAQNRHEGLEEAYRRSQEQVSELMARNQELDQRIQVLQGSPDEQAAEIARLSAERSDLMAKIDQWRTKYEDLSRRPAAGPIVLPAEVDKALREFANVHKDVVDYDAAKGMVKFRSDLTFAPGSDRISDAGRTSIMALATVLTAEAASGYEVRVVGHTDSVPIGKPSTRQLHPTNWHLSAHRAISVRSQLEKAGVPAVRTTVAGYGMYRPVEQNQKRGAEKNRRVEVYLVGMTPVNEAFLGPGVAPAPPAPDGK
ncbi:MAG: OmpA family protein [Phycisphaerae bacterium]|nr:OmpA family protein [Phycisphaerae bacterium]